MSDKPLDCVGVDAARSATGKHDFVLRKRSPDERETYFSEKIVELITTQKELAAVTRERDALKDALTRIRCGWVGPISIADEILSKLASGELRKPTS